MSATGVSTTSFDQYDPLGRVLHSTQSTAGQSAFLFSYVYDLAGALTSETYPSGRVVKTCYDGANRPTAVTAAASCNTTPYATVSSYTSHGAIKQMMLGNGIVETTTFNTRLQPTQIQAGTLSVVYNYGSSNNNGNLLQQTITWSGLSAINQYYQYDGFNRLKLASERPTNSSNLICPDAGSSWCQQYGYDAFANRSISAQSNLGASPLTPSSFDTTTNRNSGAGWGYDPAGNITADPASTVYNYDAESRQTAAGTSTYGYDGNGKRVLRTVAGNQSVYAYDTFGTLVAEYGSSNSPSGTVYLTADHLGSTRLITSAANTLVNGVSPGAAGTAIECRDYLPFGEQILVGSGSPRTGLGCASAEMGVRHQFTSKERDGESGLDYFGARYFSGAQGRFTSPDSVADETLSVPLPYADLKNPQTLNLYSYVSNNPLRYNDPDGHDRNICVKNESGGQNCVTLDEAQYQRLYLAQNGKQGINLPNGFSGNITCGGQTCGTVQYVPGKGDAQDLTVSIGLGTLGGRAISAALTRVIEFVGGLLGRTAGVAGGAGSQVAGGAGQVVAAGGKAAVRDALESGAVSELQKQAVKRALARGAAADTFTLEKLADGSIRITREVAGSAGGRATYESVVDAAGNTVPGSAVQKAYDSAGNLVHYDPKN